MPDLIENTTVPFIFGDASLPKASSGGKLENIRSMPTFHFFTLVTRDDQYDAMRDSIARVGFDESNSVFTILDNRKENAHEPYSAITKAVKEAEAPYVVFCHQDLEFYEGPEALLKAIHQVEAADPDWMVLGNAGFAPSFEMITFLDGIPEMQPGRVNTLDEDLLVIRRDSGLGCSPELNGFHLYGTDLCLNAYLRGGSAWVMEFRVEHLGTTLDFDAAHKVAPAFYRKWGRHVRGAVLFSPALVLVFTPVPFLYKHFNRRGTDRRFAMNIRGTRALDYLLRHFRPSWLPLVRYPHYDPRGPFLSRPLRLLDALIRHGRPRWREDQKYEEIGYEFADQFHKAAYEEENLTREDLRTE